MFRFSFTRRSGSLRLGAAALLLPLLLGCPSAPTPQPEGEGPPPVSGNPPAALTAPPEFKVRYKTTKGDFVVHYHRDWAPFGVDRTYTLVKEGFYDDNLFFRVVTGFAVQTGISGDPKVSKRWEYANLIDDRPAQSNTPGIVTMAKASSPHSRSTQWFINLGNNSFLDARGFAPLGEVSEGMDVVRSLYAEYGERPTEHQGALMRYGNGKFLKQFPNLDRIITAKVIWEMNAEGEPNETTGENDEKTSAEPTGEQKPLTAPRPE